jgi:hypothetical protein
MRACKNSLFVLLLSYTWPAALSAQVSFNGSFEFTDPKKLLARWFDPFVSAPNAFAVSLDSTISYEGKYSLYLRPTETCVVRASEVTIWQELDLSAFPACKALKTVEYVQTPDFDTLRANMGLSIAMKGKFTRQLLGTTVDTVYNESGLWYKVSTYREIHGEKLIAIPWIVVSNCYPVHLDNYQIYLDEKLVTDIPVNGSYYPVAADIGWLQSNSREIRPGPATDKLSWLTEEVGHASVVALGEARQAPLQTALLRGPVSEALIAQGGFSVVAIDDAVPFTVPAAKEMQKFLDWVRRYTARTGRKVDLVSLSHPQAAFKMGQTHTVAGRGVDSLLAENVRWLSEIGFPGKKILLWSGNERIATGRNRWYRDDPVYNRSPVMGVLLSQKVEKGYKSFAFLSVPDSTVEEVPADSYEYYLAMTNKPFYFTTLDSIRTAAHSHLFEHLRWFAPDPAGGAPIYPFKFYDLSGNFDGLFFIRPLVDAEAVSRVTLADSQRRVPNSQWPCR